MTPILQAERISKSFGPNKVLDAITLALQPGRIHAVIGENGAGKSTLMRILAGYLPPSEGRLIWEGAPIRFSGPLEAEHKGVVLIHQEILLADDLTVAQNVFLGREARRGWFTDDASMRGRTAFLMEELGAHASPDAETRTLSLAERQFVQIAKALLVPQRVVIFDEPTTVLTPVETEALFAVIRRLRAGGAAVLYISHRLSEVKAISDMVTVLRDGRLVTTAATAMLEPADMARLMVGREMAKLYPVKQPETGDVVLAVEGAKVPGFVEEAAFELRRGEILGFGGLVGAGRTELFEGLVGLRPCQAHVTLAGEPVRFTDPREALKAGVVYLSEDRKGKGLLLEEELRPNLTLASLDRFTRGPFIDVPAEDRALDRAIGEFDIRVRDRNLLARQLSGGNQQKLFLAKMMQLNPRIIVIDEPTRGVDIGTKQQIYKFLADLADKGVAVIVISSEMQELIGLCHRVLVMRAGRIAGEVSGKTMTEDDIVFLATGVHDRLAGKAAHRA